MLDNLGYVVANSTSTGVRATNNRPNPSEPFWVYAAQFQQKGSNTGVVRICSVATPNLTTGVGVDYEIPAPSDSAATGTRPAWAVDGGVDLSQVYILPGVSGQGVLVTYKK